MRLALAATLATLMLAPAVQGETVAFDDSWKQQGFLRLSPNRYELGGGFMGISSDNSVSLIYRPLPASLRHATKARWNWSVTQSVPATDLQTKGQDDRNISLYFVFVDPAVAERLATASARKIFGNKSMRTLVYVWGGDYAPDSVLDSPYQPGQMMMLPIRPATTGTFNEQVDLAADYRRAFGGEPGALVGMAVSADSDDTDTAVSARIEGLQLD